MVVKAKRCAAGAGLLICTFAGAGQAQDLGFLNWTPGTFQVTQGRVGLGIGMAPDYLGSDDLVATPLPSFAFSLGRMNVQNNLLGVEIDVRPGFPAPASGEPFLAYGPILRYDSGRNDGSKVEDPVVALTTPVDATGELGVFVEATVPVLGSALLTARFAVVQALSSHEGATADISVGMVTQRGPWTLGGGVAATWADGDYTSAFFDVSPTDAAKTGLPVYSASGGLLDVGLSLYASYAVSERWSVDALAGFTMVEGDAADSPLVADRGRAEQPFAGLGLTYRF
jgi:outer membrane scaffolding protein for murein synthesis (MipA/OmpV family)